MGKSFSSGGTRRTMSGWTQDSPYGTSGGGLFSNAGDFLAAYNSQGSEVPTQELRPLGPAAASPVASPAVPVYDPFASPFYTGAMNTANKNYADTVAKLHEQETLSATSLGAIRDPNNNGGWGIDWNSVDTTNPYARAALLKRSYLQGQSGSVNSMASRGMLNSGALNRAIRNGQFNYKQGQDSIDKQLAQIILSSQQGQVAAAGTKATAEQQAILAAIQAAPQPGS